MNPQIVGALLSLGGVLVGLFVRDIVMARHLARQKREHERQDRAREAADARLSDVRKYADPLYEAARSLGFRLDEIIEARNPGYLLADAPPTTFITYTRLSTSYRLAALLGWIRAFRRERSYLDAAADPEEEQTQAAITKIEAALADGQHVENDRLDDLMALWKVDAGRLADPLRIRLATDIEAERHRYFGDKTNWTADALDPRQRWALVNACADVLRNGLSAKIPELLVRTKSEEALLCLNIREAYIYRDWQAAVGDFMVVETAHGPRRFDVRGFGSFEDAYLSAQLGENQLQKRWFDRIEALFYGLDMRTEGVFDARREQIRKLYRGLKELEEVLRAKVEQLGTA